MVHHRDQNLRAHFYLHTKRTQTWAGDPVHWCPGLWSGVELFGVEWNYVFVFLHTYRYSRRVRRNLRAHFYEHTHTQTQLEYVRYLTTII